MHRDEILLLHGQAFHSAAWRHPAADAGHTAPGDRPASFLSPVTDFRS